MTSTAPKNFKSTSNSLGLSPVRVFVDVTVPRHKGPRLSLADVDIDASNALKAASMSSKVSKKSSDAPASGAAKRAGKDGRALRITTRTNSSTSIKRGREDETDEKEAVKKRKLDVQQVCWLMPRLARIHTYTTSFQKKDANDTKNGNKPSGRGGAKKLDTTTVAPVRHRYR